MSDLSRRIYHLKGDPFEIGYAMGQALGSRLDANIERYVRQRVPAGVAFDQAAWQSGALAWLRDLPDRYLEEFEGLASGAGLPLQRLAEWAYLESLLSGQCSGAILTINRQVWVARNNDIYAPELWGYVTIREVTGRIPAISFGLEGDVFTPTGINQEKLWLHTNYLPVADAPSPGKTHLPGYVLIVEALETCRTLQDLERLLVQIQRDEGMLLFAVDGKTGEFALYECACSEFYKRQPTNGWLVGTNHSCARPQVSLPDSPKPLSSASRYLRLETLVERIYARAAQDTPLRDTPLQDTPLQDTPLRDTPLRDLPIEELIEMLADDAIELRNGEIVTAYSNVACPGTQEIWYTFGGYPAASRGDWQRLAWPW